MTEKYVKSEEGKIMGITTKNLNLVKPLANEHYNIEVFNNNMDKIAEAIRILRESLSSLNLAAPNISYGKNNAATVDNALDALYTLSSAIKNNSYTDLNDATELGFFKATATATNRPDTSSSSDWYAGIVMRGNAGTVVQIAGGVNTGKLYTRKLVGGSWTSWDQILTSSSISNAINSTSQTNVASSQAVKTAYDKGVEALNKANEALNKANTVQSEVGVNRTALINSYNDIVDLVGGA